MLRFREGKFKKGADGYRYFFMRTGLKKKKT
jgi:hypothetical protein